MHAGQTVWCVRERERDRERLELWHATLDITLPFTLLSELGELRVEDDAEFCGSLISMPLSCWSLLSNLICSAFEPMAEVAKLIGLSQALTAGAGAGMGIPIENGVVTGTVAAIQ